MDKKSRDLVMAKLYFKNKDYKMAEKSFLEYLNINPEDVAALKLLAQVYEQNKRFEKAFEMYERCYLAEPDRTGVLLDICRILLMNEVWLENVDYRKWLNLAIKAFPANPIVTNFKAFLATIPSNEPPSPKQEIKINNIQSSNEVMTKLDTIEKKLHNIEEFLKKIFLDKCPQTFDKSAIEQKLPPLVEKPESVIQVPPSIVDKPPSLEVKPIASEQKTPTNVHRPSLASSNTPQTEPKASVPAPKVSLSNSKASLSEAKPPVFEMKTPTFEAKPPVFEMKTPTFEVKPPVFEMKTPTFEVKTPIFEAKTPLSEVKQATSDSTPSMFDSKPSLFNSKPPIFDTKPTLFNTNQSFGVENKQPVQDKSFNQQLSFNFSSPATENLFANSIAKLNTNSNPSWTSGSLFSFSSSADNKGGSTGIFGSIPASSKQEEQENSNEDNEHVQNEELPIENTCDMQPIEIKSGEEDEDKLFEQRCKLYRFKDKEYKERGLGSIKILKHKTTGKGRLIMRRDLVNLVCLNCWDCDKIERVRENQVRWVAVDASDGEPEMNVFLVKFKTQELTDTFMSHINNLFSNEQQTTPKKSESKPEVELVDPKLDQSLVDKARKLQLPDLFYHEIRNQGNCSGCDGCEKDD